MKVYHYLCWYFFIYVMMILYRQTVICHNMTQKRILDFNKDGQLEKGLCCYGLLLLYTPWKKYTAFFNFFFLFIFFWISENSKGCCNPPKPTLSHLYCTMFFIKDNLVALKATHPLFLSFSLSLSLSLSLSIILKNIEISAK